MKRPIYLASDSKARKALLAILGLKFTVLPSKVKEVARGKGMSYSALVQKNALRKAEAVSRKIGTGIVIAADTIVVKGKRLYGKPQSLAKARAMLKALSGSSQVIYTGIAVVDKDTGRKKVAAEKTRIVMDRLTDEEITRYFAAVSPLDKAGGFDIQGKGAFFIRRIDGCFYNVVGLPLRRLYRMLKEMGVRIFCLCLCVAGSLMVSGCSTEYGIVTGEQETYYYSVDKEVQMGRALSKQMEEKYKPVPDLLLQKRVEDIGQKIAAVCDRKDITYYFKAVDDDEVNALSLPGGYVYINKGLLDKVDNDDELAAVLAHEVGHIVARHSIKKLQAMMSYNVLRLLTSQMPGGGAVGSAADVAFTEIFLGYSREDELLADQLGARYAGRAGYNPRAMIAFLEKLQEIQKRRPAAPKNYLKTHPYVPDRIRVVKEEVGEKMGFSDYINIEDRKHE